ncbi:MAG: type IIL restriction-modification enzyme MmeI [Phormidesmis sp.]
MNQADKDRLESFLRKWLGSEGNERANYQGFFLDLCEALGVEKPLPKGNAADAPYCFDKDIKFYSSKNKAPTTRFADFYKEGCFLIEAKQGSEKSSKGHGKRGTKTYRDVMQKAFNQARQYTGMLTVRPPFLMTCDIDSHFVWEGFSGEYGSYGARQRVNLKDLAQAEEFDRFVKIFTEL